ncbi:MAG: hypothetical protein WC877_00240 [Dehalococcoidales bacterium]|jgi:hypothetical protein
MAGLDPLHSLIPVRDFVLTVDVNLLPFTTNPKKGFTSVQMKNGMWFNTRSRKPATKDLHLQYAKMIDAHIKELVQAEARKLQNYWKAKIPHFFNRRAYGMFFSKQGYGKRLYNYTRQKKGWRPVKYPFGKMKVFKGPLIGGDYLFDTRGTAIKKKYTHRQQFAGRHRSGQLRRALEVKGLSNRGCNLHVKPCYASTGRRVDYVRILMYGVSSRYGNPYVPEFDRRIKTPFGVWHGISDMYWKRWQFNFQMQVKIANDRLNRKITKYLVEMETLRKSDARIVLNQKSSKKTELDAKKDDKKSRKGKSGTPVTPNSPYNKGRVGKTGTRNRLGTRNRYTKRTPWNYYSNPYLRW